MIQKDNLKLGVDGIDIILNGLLIMKKKIFFWHRPPHANDPLWDKYKVIGKIPANPLQNTEPYRHGDCFSLLPLDQHTARSKHQN